MLDPKEGNRNNRRDKKLWRKRVGMRINFGAKKLAEILANKARKLNFMGDPGHKKRFSKRSIALPEWHLYPNELERLNREKKRRTK